MYNLWDSSGAVPEQDTRTAMMHHSMMQLCRVDFPPFKMQTTIPGYGGHNQFEGILELRKEKSRDAARSRRGKENYEFYELAKMLPLPGAITSQLDKASIVRLTIASLKLKDFSCHGDPPWQREGPSSKQTGKGGAPRRRSITNYSTEIFENHQGTHILQSLDGFGFTLSNDGRFLYISETVSIYLGLSQVEVTGSSIFEYIHPGDQQELAEQLGLSSSHYYSSSAPSPSPADDEGSSSSTPRTTSPTTPERASIMNPSPSKGLERCFCIRMKSTLTKRGVHVKSSGYRVRDKYSQYRVVQILGHMRPQYSFSLARKHPPPILGLVAIAIALPPPTITELIIDSDMFVSRMSPDLSITYVEPRIGDMMDLPADDLTHQNLYNYCHAEDLQKLKKAHVDLLSKGQVLTDYYRLMNKHGGYVWIQTCATVLFNTKNQEEQNIIAINYVLSGIEYPGCIMNTNQLRTVTNSGSDNSDHSESDHCHDRGHFKHEPSSHSAQDFTAHEHAHGNQDLLRGHKRKHSPSASQPHDIMESSQPQIPGNAVTAVNHLLEFGSIASPSAGLDLFCNNSQGSPSDVDTNMNNLYNDDERLVNGDKNCRLDAKNSRRKMDKPRKRKRDSLDADIGTVEKGNFSPDMNNDTGSVHENGETTMDSNAFGMEGNSMITNGNIPNCPSVTRSESVHSNTTPTSPKDVAPNSVPNSVSTPIPEDLTIQTTSHSSPEITLTSPVSTPANNSIHVGKSACTTDNKSSHEGWPLSSCSSNIPSCNGDVVASSSSSVRDLEEVMNKHLPITAHMEEHLRNEYAQSFLGLGKHKSTIQWVGSGSSSMSADMTASNLLRSLYASRETVIRSNVYNPRPQYYTDMQTTLLTPPGATTDPYKDSFPSLAHSKTPPATYNGLSYPANSVSVSMASGMTDGFSMTPPSSVSPQDKYHSSYGDQFHYGHDAASMPIKPQAYPLPAHANAGLGSFDRGTTNEYTQYYGNAPGITPYNHAGHYT